MRSAEQKLSILGGAVVVASGALWMVPVINSVAAFAGIVALILIVTRLGYARAFLLALIGFLLAFGTGSLTIGYLDALYYGFFYALSVLAPAFVMGWASRNLYEPAPVVCYGIIPFGILFLLFAYVYVDLIRDPTVFIESLKTDLETAIRANPELLRLVEENYESQGNALEFFLKEIGQFIGGVLKIIPGFLFAVMLGTAVFSLAVAGYVASRMGIITTRFRPFHHWKASGWWLLPTILGLIPVVFNMDELWFYVGLNILIVTGHVYMVVGLAIVEAFFKRIILPMPIKVIFYVILILAGPVSIAFLAILGLSDTKFNFKREIEDFENKE